LFRRRIVLVTEDQDLDVLGRVVATKEGQPLGGPAEREVQQAQRHEQRCCPTCWHARYRCSTTVKWAFGTPQVHLLADEDELLPGLTVFWVGTHHRSSVAVKVVTDEGVVIGSDCFMRRENVTENRPLGINESLAEALTAYERIHHEADILVPLYDPGVFHQYPKGIGVLQKGDTQ
jgi:hypothetical protein